jgi:hypothetical protein
LYRHQPVCLQAFFEKRIGTLKVPFNSIEKRTPEVFILDRLIENIMANCLNCGAPVSPDEIVCKACGYDPKSKGVKPLGDKDSVERFDAGRIGVSEKTDIYCPNCGKSYEKTPINCVHCNESNPYEDFPLRNYIINNFLVMPRYA